MTRPALKARRLRTIADEAKARYDALEGEREAAADLCRPGPHPAVVEKARQDWLAAEAAADTAAKLITLAEQHRIAGAAIADRRFAQVGGNVETVQEAEHIWAEVQLSLGMGVRMVNLRAGLDDPGIDRVMLAEALAGFADRARQLGLAARAGNDNGTLN